MTDSDISLDELKTLIKEEVERQLSEMGYRTSKIVMELAQEEMDYWNQRILSYKKMREGSGSRNNLHYKFGRNIVSGDKTIFCYTGDEPSSCRWHQFYTKTTTDQEMISAWKRHVDISHGEQKTVPEDLGVVTYIVKTDGRSGDQTAHCILKIEETGEPCPWYFVFNKTVDTYQIDEFWQRHFNKIHKEKE